MCESVGSFEVDFCVQMEVRGVCGTVYLSHLDKCTKGSNLMRQYSMCKMFRADLFFKQQTVIL